MHLCRRRQTANLRSAAEYQEKPLCFRSFRSFRSRLCARTRCRPNKTQSRLPWCEQRLPLGCEAGCTDVSSFCFVGIRKVATHIAKLICAMLHHRNYHPRKSWPQLSSDTVPCARKKTSKTYTLLTQLELC